jgi:hypothetical protein
MRPVTRFILPVILLFIASALPCGAPGTPRAPADEAISEIRLGKPAVPAPKPDPATTRAVERFLAARQSASVDRYREAGARRLLSGTVKADAATLVGKPGQTMVAFDFRDGAIERLGSGRFRVQAYLLFADVSGRIVESRDEALTFTGGAGGYLCTSLKTASVMSWDSSEAFKSASRLRARDALERANEFLLDWAKRQTSPAGYSIEDVYAAGAMRVMIPCLRFTAEFGKRGYDVVDSPLIMRRGPKGYRLEPAAN